MKSSSLQVKGRGNLDDIPDMHVSCQFEPMLTGGASSPLFAHSIVSMLSCMRSSEVNLNMELP
jgi:hypothetical protein